MPEELHAAAGARQLRRLETFTDCVYAVSLLLITTWLPEPMPGDRVWLLELFAGNVGDLAHVLVAVVFVILYWLRSNKLMGYLRATDVTHTTFSILQVFFILFLLYVVNHGAEMAEQSRRASESFALFLTGFAGAGAWGHAKRKEYHLVDARVDEDEKMAVQLAAFTEPLTALLTMPFAYIGELYWNLAWLLLFPVSVLLKRWRKM